MNMRPNHGTSKDRASTCAAKLRAISDANRLAVLRALLERPLHVGEINQRVPIDQSLLSHHLRVLRDADVVQATRDGKAVLYSIAAGALVSQPGLGIDLGCCRVAFDQVFLDQT
jgi:ArsR family transcriptional regulator